MFCDMRSGGWTLIGQIVGVNDNTYDKWMATNVNTGLLRRPTIKNWRYGCTDSVDLAVISAHEVSRYSNKITNIIGLPVDSVGFYICGLPSLRPHCWDTFKRGFMG